MLFKSHDHHSSFIINRDSESSIDATKSPMHNPLISPILNHFKKHTRYGYDIFFYWVAGRVGFAGNEKADKTAKNNLNTLCHQIHFKIYR